MKLNRIDLKKTQYEFNSISNRLLQADCDDYLDVLRKFISFLNRSPLIFDYISDCGESDQNIEQEVEAVKKEYGGAIFSTGDTEQEEVRSVYAILKYIVDENIEVQHGVALGYSSSDEYQDIIKGFNNRFVMILIRYIENFLTRVGIEMGLDDKVVYNVTVQNGQAIFAGDNSMITAKNNIGIDAEKLRDLIAEVRRNSENLSLEEIENTNECLEVLEEETQAKKPRKSFINTAICTLSAIKGTAEFTAAVAALIQFVSTIL